MAHKFITKSRNGDQGSLVTCKSGPKGIQGDPRRAKRAPRATPSEPKVDLETSKRRPRGGQKMLKGARLDLLVFYNDFRRPQSPGRMRCGALITYRLGRLTELNITLIKLLCTIKQHTATDPTRTGVPAGTVRI